MKACKAGSGSPRCDYKTNAKGTPLFEDHGYPVGCSYNGICVSIIEVN